MRFARHIRIAIFPFRFLPALRSPCFSRRSTHPTFARAAEAQWDVRLENAVGEISDAPRNADNANIFIR